MGPMKLATQVLSQENSAQDTTVNQQNDLQSPCMLTQTTCCHAT
jgi:hypothetical protein